jgi:hypothetical protein
MRLRIAISGQTLDGACMFGYSGEVELRELPHEAKLQLQLQRSPTWAGVPSKLATSSATSPSRGTRPTGPPRPSLSVLTRRRG